MYDHDRVVKLPGLGVSEQDMLDSLARVGGQERLQHVSEQEDDVVKKIPYSWPVLYDKWLFTMTVSRWSAPKT